MNDIEIIALAIVYGLVVLNFVVWLLWYKKYIDEPYEKYMRAFTQWTMDKVKK